MEHITLQTSKITQLGHAVLEGARLNREEALFLLEADEQQRYELFYWANYIRIRCLGPEVTLCAIASARTAGCTEDCRFCAQSRHYHTHITPQTAAAEQLIAAAQNAKNKGAHSFGIVASGRRLTDDAMDRYRPVISAIINDIGIGCCASLGCLTDEQAQQLFEMGVRRYNHNLETSENYFPKVVTTHSYAERIDTVRAVQKAGMEVCCGGIIGMGESKQDRVDLALKLRDLDVDMVPMNFLHPIAGTPFADLPVLAPMEALQTIAMFRFVLPDKQIKMAGGREKCLRDLQSWMFFAGASATIIGNYLTTTGRAAEDDLQMLADLGMKWEKKDL